MRMIEVLKAKIHRAVVTGADIQYEGSITIHENFMEEVGLREYEKVTVADINNAVRFDTYVIKGNNRDNPICVNGAAARLVAVGDRIIIMAYQLISDQELDGYMPRILLLDKNNCKVAQN